MTPTTPRRVRTARVPDHIWSAAGDRAKTDHTTLSNAVALLVEGYATNAIDRPDLTYPEPATTRTARIPDNVWNQAGQRARADDTNMSHVVAALIGGYATGILDLPRLVYTPQRNPTE